MSRVARKEQPARTKKDWARILEGVRGTITHEAPLQSYTSFRIGGPAEVLVEPSDVEDVCRLVAQAHGGELLIERAQPGLRVAMRWAPARRGPGRD